MGKYPIEDLFTWISNRHWGLHKHDTCSIKRERGRRVVRQPRSAWLNMAFALSRSWWGKADRGANIHETMGMRVIDIWCWKRTSTPRPLVLIPFPLSLDFTLHQIWEEHCSKDRRMIWKKWPGRIVWVLAMSLDLPRFSFITASSHLRYQTLQFASSGQLHIPSAPRCW